MPNNHVYPTNSRQRQLQLQHIISIGLKRIEERKSTYRIGGHKFNLQEQVAQAAEFLEWARDWIDDAVQTSPQASIAWAAVCLALPLLTKPVAAEQASRDGFTYVTARMRYYAALENLMLPRSQTSQAHASTELREALEAHVIDLYRQILDFQFRSILRFYRSALGKFVCDLVPGENWKQMLEKIKDFERIIDNGSRQISTFSSRETLESLAKSSDGFAASMQQLLVVTERQLQVGVEHRDISAEQLRVQVQTLQTQEAMNRRAMSDDEMKCIQTFRLHRAENDQSYEWYKDRVENRVEGTCQWFLEHDHFKQWSEQDSGPLLVSADPGCGKSVLSKYLIDHQLPRSATICYFFFKDQVQNTLRQALCALLHQIFSASPSLIRHAMPGYSRNGPNLVNVIAVLQDILHKASHDPKAGPLILVLDALDECNDSDFKDLMGMLQDQFQSEKDRPSKLKILLTCRPYEQITSKFRVLEDAFPYVRIPGEEESKSISQEVNCVIKHRVNQLAKEKGLDEELKNHLEQRLLEVPHRTYLWVHLVFDYLERGFKKTKKAVEDSITTLPESVNEAYDKILSRSTDRLKAQRTLSIILAAVRPLTLREMNVAVNIEFSPASKSETDLDLEDEKSFRDTLRNWCGLFISIYDNQVYFLHQTAREFLMPHLQSPASASVRSLFWYGLISREQAQLVLAKICIMYLDFHEFENKVQVLSYHTGVDYYERRSSPYVLTQIDRYALLEYSAKNWHSHYRRAHIILEDDADLMSTVLRICDTDTDKFKNWFWFEPYGSPVLDAQFDFPRLTVASYLGLAGVVELLLEGTSQSEIDSVHGSLELALYYAARWSQKAVEYVKHEAVFKHEAVVKLLLDRVADLQTGDGSLAFCKAATSGREPVVRLMIDRGAEINPPIYGERTALHSVAQGGQEAIARLLLDRGADPSAPDGCGVTALHLAAMGGREAMVRLLIDRGVDVNVHNDDGATALHFAVRGGHDAVARLLLDSGAEIDAGERQATANR